MFDISLIKAQTVTDNILRLFFRMQSRTKRNNFFVHLTDVEQIIGVLVIYSTFALKKENDCA